MYEYPVNAEMARLTIILGVVVATLIYKQTGLTMGGVVVPGYLALFALQPLHILVTLAIASLAFVIVHNYMKGRFMLNNRALFEVEILVALVLQVIWSALLTLSSGYNPDWAALYGIGFVIPGLITHEVGRQGWRQTMLTTLFGALIVFLMITPLAAIEERLPAWMTVVTTSPILRTQPYTYAFPLKLLPIAIIISVLIDLFAANRFKTRAGGFVTAAYLALFLPRPLDILFVVVGAVATYLFVKYLASRHLLIFGRTRMGMLILSAVVIAWLMEIAVLNLTHGTFAPWSGFVVIMPMLVALLASSFDTQGLSRTFAVVGASGAAVFLLMQGLVLSLLALNVYMYFV